MTKPKLGKSKDNEPMHYSVGALIKQDDKYLLIDRAIPPFGFAAVAGHIDEGEEAEQSLIREVREETGLDIEKYNLLFEEEIAENKCSKGINVHYWYLFECEVSGEIKRNERETKSIDWYSKEEIKKLELESVWKYLFKKLKII